MQIIRQTHGRPARQRPTNFTNQPYGMLDLDACCHLINQVVQGSARFPIIDSRDDPLAATLVHSTYAPPQSHQSLLDSSYVSRRRDISFPHSPNLGRVPWLILVLSLQILHPTHGRSRCTPSATRTLRTSPEKTRTGSSAVA